MRPADTGSIKALLGAAAAAEVIDLGHELFAGMPVHESHPPFLYTPYHRHGDWTLEGDYWGTNELMVLTGHTGTHVDALSHIAYRGRFFDGSSALESLDGVSGFRRLGAETIEPIVGRGIYLDFATLEGRPILPRDYSIDERAIRQCLGESGLEIRTGDSVLIRTGLGGLWESGSEYLASSGGNPGIDLSAARYLETFRPAAVGSDTTVVEVCDAEPETLPVHSFLLAQRGVHLIENLDLESMPRVPAIEFLFVCAPVKVRGSSGALVRPLALIPHGDVSRSCPNPTTRPNHRSAPPDEF
jgi:kynurenine formamidase